MITFTTLDEVVLTRLDFGSVERGSQSEVRKVRIHSDTNYSGVTISADESLILQVGDLGSTVLATWISIDGVNFYQTVKFKLDANTFKDILIKWVPASNIKMTHLMEERRWSLKALTETVTIEPVCD